jgi:tetratricopeptide (TPR) repeat protein
MADEAAIPELARELSTLIEAFEGRAVLARLADERDGGALPPAIRGILRARALAAGERYFTAYELLGEVRSMRELTAIERVEAQVYTARVLRLASPLINYALTLSTAAAEAGPRLGAFGKKLSVRGRVEAALLFARKRCRKLAEAQLDQADALGVDRALSLMARSDVAITFDERVLAKTTLEELRTFAGRCEDPEERAVAERLAHLGLGRLYVVLGEFDSAERELSALGARPAGDIAAHHLRYRLAAERADWKAAAAALGEMIAAAPDSERASGRRLERASALYRAGNVDAAREAWAEMVRDGGNEDAGKSAAQMLAALDRADAKTTRLAAFPSVSQLRNHCGPASVELCLRYFGVSADQVEVAREIKHPDGGTPVHRMREYMNGAGFHTRRVEADLPKLKAILDAGVPVIIEEDYSTTRHVAVAIGYDDRRQLLEVQDPMTHEIRETPYDALPKLREFSNHGALVSIPGDRPDLAAKLDAIGAVECEYMSLTDRAWQARDQKREADGDALVDKAIELHEAYELAWVYRFVRARDRYDEEPGDERKGQLVEVVNHILHLWPDDEWPQQFLGRLYDLEDRPGPALAAYEKARDRDPDDANNWCAIGDCHLSMGARDEARKALEESVKRDPGHVRANENLSNVLFDAGDVGLAKTLNDCALELAPDNPFNHHVRGRILGKSGDFMGAAAAYDRALELRPKFPGYVLERARHLAKAGKVDEALGSLGAAVAEREGDAYLLTQLADLAYEYGALDLCISTCETLSKVSPDSASWLAMTGAALCKRGDLVEGTATIERALDKYPAYAWAHRELGRALVKAERPKDAVMRFAAAAGLQPSWLLSFLLGDALARAGAPSPAEHHLRRAAESGELDEVQLARVAAVLRENNGAQSAHELFQKLAEMHPRSATILRSHARFLVGTLWVPGAAAPVLAALSEVAPDDPFVLAKEADDAMDESEGLEARGEELFRRAITQAPDLLYARRLFTRQLNSRGRFAEALEVAAPCRPDAETLGDRVHAHLGSGDGEAARKVIEAFALQFPDEARGAERRPLDFKVAQAERRFEDALALSVSLSEDAGELADDGELSTWEEERFKCLVELGRGDEAYEFGSAQCADADDRGNLAYEALAAGDTELAHRLASEALEEDPDQVLALHVMARAAEAAGDLDAAKGIWQRMRQITNWHIHSENLGRLALAEGDLETAAGELESAVENGHCCPVALELRAELRLLQGKRDEARADAKRARACLQLPLYTVSEHIDGLLLGLDGKREDAKRAYDAYMAREKLSQTDRTRLGKVLEALL